GISAEPAARSGLRAELSCWRRTFRHGPRFRRGRRGHRRRGFFPICLRFARELTRRLGRGFQIRPYGGGCPERRCNDERRQPLPVHATLTSLTFPSAPLRPPP